GAKRVGGRGPVRGGVPAGPRPFNEHPPPLLGAAPAHRRKDAFDIAPPHVSGDPHVRRETHRQLPGLVASERRTYRVTVEQHKCTAGPDRTRATSRSTTNETRSLSPAAAR